MSEIKKIGGDYRRPNVVAIGGGHGLSRTLLAAKSYAGSISAIVTVADDGGSSRVFRDELAVPALGDIRRCLIALADNDSLLAKVMSYRFLEGSFQGHPVGNFILAALCEMNSDLEAASSALGEELSAAGRVFPACNSVATLTATTDSGELISGQVAVMQRSGISEVKLVGQDINAPEKALLAIKEADQIIIGPGSLYTSLLAALSAEGIREAIETSEGRKIYIANLQQQKYETFGYNIADHIRALNKHGIKCDVTLLPVKSVLESGDIPDDTETIKVPLTTESGNIHDHNLLGEALAGLWLRHLESDKEV